MSDTFKFLESAGEDNEAQKFLKKRMDSYSPEQRAMLEASGGPSKVGASHGVVPEGAAYDAQNPTKNQASKKSSTSTTSTGSDAYKDFDVNDKYKSGQWGSGKLSQQDLADKYGLDTSAEANKGDTAVWGTNRTGERVFLGNIDNSQRSNDDVIKAHLAQADSGEAKHGDVPESVSSDGDVIGAMLNMWDGGAAPEVEAAPEIEEEENKPIEHSPEIKQATERVRAYEDDVMSGKTSSDIFGDTYGNTGLDLSKASVSSTNNNQPDAMQRINDKYSINLNQGAAGIGTAAQANDTSTTKATDNFLQSKKSEYKTAFNFKPTSYATYGTNS